MKILVQRVARAGVRVAGRDIGRIGGGLAVLVGVRRGDREAQALALAAKTAALRVFPDAQGRMNRSLLDTGGSVLAVPQFTLYADTRRGNRPGFAEAAPPGPAEALFEAYVRALRGRLGPGRVETGRFGADMELELVNEGPVTLELSDEAGPPGP